MSPTPQRTDDVTWSKDAELMASQIAATPEEPGVLLLVRRASSPNQSDRVVWAEAPDNLRHRAHELAGHATVGPELGSILLSPDICFRYAVVHDHDARERILERHKQSLSIPPPA